MGSIATFGSFLLALLLFIPRKTYALLLDGLASVIEAIPAPSFVQSTVGAIAQLGSDVLWWAGLFKIGAGLSMMLAASVLRFAIRRIPVIG